MQQDLLALEGKERKKFRTKRACEGHRVRVGIQSYIYSGQGCGGELSGMRVATTLRRLPYVMAVLSGARVVHVMCVCVAAPCCWAACGCDGDAAKVAWRWLTHPGRASTKRFLFLMIPIRRECIKPVSKSRTTRT